MIMDYPEMWTVWVVREKPHLVGQAMSKKEAVDIGERTVSTKDYVVKKYVVSECNEPAQPEIQSKPVLSVDNDTDIDFDSLPPPELDL